MRAAFFSLGIMLAAAWPAAAQAQSPAPPKPMQAERLVMPLFPAGWTMVTQSQASDVEIVEYVPDGENAEQWTEKIVLQIYHSMNSLPLDAIHHRSRMNHRETCEGPIEGPFQSGKSNGFASAFWALGCQQQKAEGFGQTAYSKAIQGDNTLYVISRVWRTPPFDTKGPPISATAVQESLAFLTTSVICVDGSEEHPCPK